MYDVTLTVIIVLGGVLFAVTMFMEWVGVMNIVTKRSGPRYAGCGHLKAIPDGQHDSCWRCRHARLDHALHVPATHLHRGH